MRKSSSLQDSLEKALSEARKQIDAGIIQGAVLGTVNGLVAAIGNRTVIPERSPMTVDCRFDIASVGKVFTASCAALLILQGKLDPDAPFTEYLPEHILGKQCDITIRDLASHCSGFDNSKPYHSSDPKVFYHELFAMKPVRPRLEAFEYSCYNMILLGTILNRITGMDLDSLARQLVWAPLGMNDTTWIAPGNGPREVQHHNPTREPGVHNDPVCHDINIPLGSGSCFSTCSDMLLFVGDLLARKQFPDAYYKLLTTCYFDKDGARRSFGWDMRTICLPGDDLSNNSQAALSKRMPSVFSDSTIYHTGWTGQTIALDPVTGHNGVVLTSRLGGSDWNLAKLGRARLLALLNDD